MRQKYYYLRNNTGCGTHPFACVCLVESDDGRIARGISVCSVNDHFSKRIGRNKAYGYALKALQTNENTYKRLPIGGAIMRDIAYRVVNIGDHFSPEYMNKFKFVPGKYLQSSVLNDKTDVPLTVFEENILSD